MIRRALLAAVLVGIVVLGCARATMRRDAALPALRVRGAHFVGPDDRPVTLRGCNLGNWLLVEPWMLGMDPRKFPDQHALVTALERRFGNDETQRLMDVYREHWITQADMDRIAAMGLNVVRVPFDYRLLEDDAKPKELRTDAFKWLDRAVEMAQRAGLYVILDMHSVPGGQSLDAPTGHAGQNRFFGDPAAQERTAWLWQRIAEHFRGQAGVIAYDLINEPYGDYKVDHGDELITVVGRIHDAIRQVDPDRLVLLPGTADGIEFYGDPHRRGWTNVGFTEHFYPGLFGGEPTLAAHGRFVAYELPRRDEFLTPLNVPYLVGEFNPVLASVGGSATLRTYFDLYANRAWAATMWAYKKLTPEGGAGRDGWALVGNAAPWSPPDVYTETKDRIESAFTSLSSMTLADQMRIDTEPMPLPGAGGGPGAGGPPRVSVAPSDQTLSSWEASDIGGASRGGLSAEGPDAAVIWGGGRDLFGRRDEFRFVERQVHGDFDLRAVVTGLDAMNRFAKAGLMVRAGLEPDAAHVLIHVFADGRVMLAARPSRGELTYERCAGITQLPTGLGLRREGAALVASFTNAQGEWQNVQVLGDTAIESDARVGLAVLSHDAHSLAAASFEKISFSDHAQQPLKLETPAAAPNLLRNASFEDAKDDKDAADRAKGWERWGDWFNREVGWTPCRTGKCILAYHHWQIGGNDDSGVYQDVAGVHPGRKYEFTIYANLDPGDGRRLAEKIELRLESPKGETMLNLASQTYKAADLTKGSQWSLLRVTGQAVSEKMRVLVIVTPAQGEGPRDGAIKFDDAVLTENKPR